MVVVGSVVKKYKRLVGWLVGWLVDWSVVVDVVVGGFVTCCNMCMQTIYIAPVLGSNTSSKQQAARSLWQAGQA